MIKILLSTVDRERLGLSDEPLEYDPKRLMAREASMLHRATGFDPVRLGRALQGTQARHPETGEPLWEFVLDEEGHPVLDEHGQAKREPVLDADYRAWLAVVWLALVRRGYTVPFKDFDFDIFGMEVKTSPTEEAEAAGEAPAPGTPGGQD